MTLKGARNMKKQLLQDSSTTYLFPSCLGKSSPEQLRFEFCISSNEQASFRSALVTQLIHQRSLYRIEVGRYD